MLNRGLFFNNLINYNIMHEWHTKSSPDILSLVNEFEGYNYRDDYGSQTVRGVIISERVFTDTEAACTYVTDTSYRGRNAYIATCYNKKVTKAYQNAFRSFLDKYNECVKFEKELTIAYDRKSSKATCPNCESSISLSYGRNFKRCPVCGSTKIISDSNWKTLETKRGMVKKASQSLKEEAIKCGVVFVGGFEWHC